MPDAGGAQQQGGALFVFIRLYVAKMELQY
jgi:hypothetical protein